MRTLRFLAVLALLFVPATVFGGETSAFNDAVKSTTNSSQKQIKKITKKAKKSIKSTTKQLKNKEITPQQALKQATDAVASAIFDLGVESDETTQSLALFASLLGVQDGELPKGSVPGECGSYDEFVAFLNSETGKAVKVILKQLKKTTKELAKVGVSVTFQVDSADLQNPAVPLSGVASAAYQTVPEQPKFLGLFTSTDDGSIVILLTDVPGMTVEVFDPDGSPLDLVSQNGSDFVGFATVAEDLPPGVYTVTATGPGGETNAKLITVFPK